MKYITAYFDGCCEPINPGGTASFGAVIFVNDKRVKDISQIFYPVRGREKETSNNVAEYSGFISLLEYFISEKLTGEKISVYGDSKLVILQMFGRWRIKKGFYVPLAKKAKILLKNFTKIKGFWIPREENSIADELSKAQLLKAGIEFKIQPV
jgi:ribonuclease HI